MPIIHARIDDRNPGAYDSGMRNFLMRCALFLALGLGSATAADLRLLVPLYAYPAWYAPAAYIWDDVAAAASQVPITAIINPNSGPDGGPPNSDYAHGLAELRAAGVSLLGYVATGYGARSAAAVKADIDLYDAYFDVDGIFLDEADNTPTGLAYYTDLYAYIHSRSNLSDVVINPGIGTAEEYLSAPAADTAVIFEVDQGWTNHVPAAYVSNYPPQRFAVLLYDVADAATMRAYVDLAVRRHIGYLYVTDDRGANPWDTLPTYWTNLVDYVADWRNLGLALSSTNSTQLDLRLLPDHPYQIRHSSNLLAGLWQDLTNGIATTARVSIPDPGAPVARDRFYLLHILP